jgi:hypothetical protein
MRRIHKHDADVFAAAQEVSKFGQARLRAKRRLLNAHMRPGESFIWLKARVKRLPNRRKGNNPMVIVLEVHEMVSSRAAALLSGGPHRRASEEEPPTGEVSNMRCNQIVSRSRLAPSARPHEGPKTTFKHLEH